MTSDDYGPVSESPLIHIKKPALNVGFASLAHKQFPAKLRDGSKPRRAAHDGELGCRQRKLAGIDSTRTQYMA